MTRLVKFILKKPERKQKPAKPSKPKPRVLVHRVFGECAVLGIFFSDSGSIVVDCDVAGERRTLSLDAQYWLTPIAELLAAMPPQSRPVSKQEKPVPVVGEPEADTEPEAAVELALNDSGHFSEGDAPEDEDEMVSAE